MKKLYFLLFLFSLSFNLYNAQNINIPDANFKAYLVSNFDANKDGEIQLSEANSVTEINCNQKNISSLEGINSFTNLQTLFCSNNLLTNLEFNGLNMLKILDCSDNNVANLNLQQLPNLESLFCSNNKLASLNVTELKNLKTLLCYKNLLTSLNLQGLNKLITVNCYDNKINSINFSNCISLKYLFADSNNLATLNFSDLSSLEELSIDFNHFTTLDVTSLHNLTAFTCAVNQLTSLNVQGLTQLKKLSFVTNKISSINLRGLVNLQELFCNGNLLTSLNLAGLNEIKRLGFAQNEINLIDLLGLSKLEVLDCSYTKLSTLDLKNFKNLQELSCTNTTISSIDVQGLENLNALYCYDNPNLKSLFVKNGSADFYGTIYNTPSLQFICCDETELVYFQNYIFQAGLKNQCVANSYCSFTPGGNFNTTQGNTRIDSNNNGCDASDLSFFPIKFLLSDGTKTGILAGNTDGTFKTYLNEGNYTLTPIFENPDYFNVSPSNGQFSFADSNNNIQNQDFCITSNGVKNDLEVKIIPVNTVRPGFETTFKLIYKNKGNTVLNGDLNFVFDVAKSQLISTDTLPDSQSAGTLMWNFINLKPFESKTITIVLKTNAPPIVNINDILKYTSTINPVSGDLTDYDNTFNLKQTVVGSFDPNDKICLEGDAITPDLIGKYVTYKIRFENTGTANAEQVVVKDIIDESMFDVKSLIPITASHSYQTRFTGNIVEFIFENINLPFDDANNDGYIVFKIKTLPTLKIGLKIKNKADIFFDYNLPIKTNEYVSTFQTLATTENLLSSKEIAIYPNPAREVLHIKTEKKLGAVTIYDNAGRIIRKSSSPSKDLDVKMLPKGSYILKIETDKGFSVQKFIKE